MGHGEAAARLEFAMPLTHEELGTMAGALARDGDSAAE